MAYEKILLDYKESAFLVFEEFFEDEIKELENPLTHEVTMERIFDGCGDDILKSNGLKGSLEFAAEMVSLCVEKSLQEDLKQKLILEIPTLGKLFIEEELETLF